MVCPKVCSMVCLGVCQQAPKDPLKCVRMASGGLFTESWGRSESLVRTARDSPPEKRDPAIKHEEEEGRDPQQRKERDHLFLLFLYLLLFSYCPTIPI
jgi:hypothetical protein